jgi:hypothetical protein
LSKNLTEDNTPSAGQALPTDAGLRRRAMPIRRHLAGPASAITHAAGALTKGRFEGQLESALFRTGQGAGRPVRRWPEPSGAGRAASSRILRLFFFRFAVT